jgi:hypothetical protein
MLNRQQFEVIKDWSQGNGPVPVYLVAGLVKHCEELAYTIVKQAVEMEKLRADLSARKDG